MDLIRLNNVSKKIEDREILKHIDLNINQGEMISITGPSGSGKTTLLNILGLIDSDYTGDYFFEGEHNLKANSSKTQKIIRSEISYLFQNFALIENETVSFNLLLALKYIKKSKKEKLILIEQILDKLHLNGYLNKKIASLSGGEQQRVALARAVIKPCKLILADEPTGSLDETNRDTIIDLLKVLNDEGKTIIIVTHDPIVANNCHKIIQL